MTNFTKLQNVTWRVYFIKDPVSYTSILEYVHFPLSSVFKGELMQACATVKVHRNTARYSPKHVFIRCVSVE